MQKVKVRIDYNELLELISILEHCLRPEQLYQMQKYDHFLLCALVLKDLLNKLNRKLYGEQNIKTLTLTAPEAIAFRMAYMSGWLGAVSYHTPFTYTLFQAIDQKRVTI